MLILNHAAAGRSTYLTVEQRHMNSPDSTWNGVKSGPVAPFGPSEGTSSGSPPPPSASALQKHRWKQMKPKGAPVPPNGRSYRCNVGSVCRPGPGRSPQKQN